MTSLFRPRNTFLQNNAWQNQALNALHYNTSQQGSVVPLIYGTMRQNVNLIDLGDYRGPTGKKGKSGSLPLSGTSQTGKGGGSGKGKSGKKNADYTVNVDFAVCQGPITLNLNNSVYSSSGVESFSATGLYFYNGSDDQALDSVFNKVNYSGTCHVIGKPIDLGQSPVLPNLAFEITGILAGVHTGNYNLDANPADVITDFLTNARYGVGFPSNHLSQLAHDDTGAITNTYGDYCQAAQLLISVSLDGHQKAIEWLDGIMKLTNSALVWSGSLLKVVPYGDLTLNSNSASWAPNWTSQYNLTDDHFLPWHPRQEGSAPTPGEDDPVILTRTNPADADNWVSIEYLDRSNFYNSTTITAFDQGAIDTYELRIGDSMPGRAFANQHPAQISIQLTMQRRLYIRNTGIKFQLGWQFALLEPMDFVNVTGRFGDNYLNQYPVRITVIEENDNGDLSLTCEDPQAGVGAPVTSPPPFGAVYLNGIDMLWPTGVFRDPTTGAIVSDPGHGSYGWDVSGPPNSPSGTFSTWLKITAADAPASPTAYNGLVRTVSYTGGTYNNLWELVIEIDYYGAIEVAIQDTFVYVGTHGGIKFDGSWHHVLVTWNAPNVQVWINGKEQANTATPLPTWPTIVNFKSEISITFYAAGGLLHYADSVDGCVQDGWFDVPTMITDPSKFRTFEGRPVDLGFRGQNVTGSPPRAFFHYYPSDYTGPDPIRFVGPSNFNFNRAGNLPDHTTVVGDPWYNQPFGDPSYPNTQIEGALANPCSTNPY